ncbi:uncharacterized protein [Apostichopus japonicus]|uniref:uncharacterized protein isoform X2 n=1 Tax=Stichopus japonicus TaxID=307972 RepID=UPI003AB6A306
MQRSYSLSVESVIRFTLRLQGRARLLSTVAINLYLGYLSNGGNLTFTGIFKQKMELTDKTGENELNIKRSRREEENYGGSFVRPSQREPSARPNVRPNVEMKRSRSTQWRLDKAIAAHSGTKNDFFSLDYIKGVQHEDVSFVGTSVNSPTSNMPLALVSGLGPTCDSKLNQKCADQSTRPKLDHAGPSNAMTCQTVSGSNSTRNHEVPSSAISSSKDEWSFETERSMGDDITRRSNAPGDIGFDREELARLNSSVQSINEEVSFEDDIDSVNVDFEETDSMEECETWFDSQEDFDMSEDTLNGDMSVTCDQTEAENSASDEGCRSLLTQEGIAYLFGNLSNLYSFILWRKSYLNNLIEGLVFSTQKEE